MLSSLPICAAFRSKSSGKYLRYNKYVDDSAGASHQLIQLSGDDAVNPCTRLYIEPSTKHDGLVHVRCSYNNKYWVAQQRPNDDGWWIAGAADEPEEDLSLQACTLFQLKTDEGGDANTVRLMHSQSGKYCGILADSTRANGAFQACLHVSGEEKSEDLTLVTLLETALPKHVCFKGDNGQYLRAETASGIHRLIFSAEGIEDQAARHTTVTTSDGTAMRIKSDALGLFWRRMDPTTSSPSNWVLVDSSDTSDGDRNILFQSSLLDDGPTIGLLNLGNNLYCKRYTTGVITHGLAAMEENTDSPWAKIQLQEPVVARGMSILRYGIRDARVYDVEELTLATASATNDTSSPMTVKLTFEFTLTETQRWSSSMTLRSPVMTIISSQAMSMVDQRSGLVVGPHFTAIYSWGTTIEKSSQETVVRFVDLPPMTKVTATCRAIKSSYDVPFSYLQADTLISGEQVSLDFDDGIYSGQNFHDLAYMYQTEKV